MPWKTIQPFFFKKAIIRQTFKWEMDKEIYIVREKVWLQVYVCVCVSVSVCV